LIKRQDSVGAGEAHCDLLGDLAARAADGRPPDLRQWAEIERALAARPGFWRGRRLALVIPALAVLGLAFWITADRVLGPRSQDCSLARDESLSAPDDRGCAVEFHDGTRITLDKATRGQLHAPWFWRNAHLTLLGGHADLSVFHRQNGGWQVLAGPLAVRVTGTKFEVDWAPGPRRFKLGVSEGEVSVSGGPLRAPTPVRAGRTLDVNTATGDVVEGDLGAPAEAQAASPTAQAASPESQAKTAPESAVASSPAVRAGRKRGASSSKTTARNLAFFARGKTPSPPPEALSATPEPAPREWTASSAADDEPAPAPPGPRRLTIGKNGELVGGVTGSVRALSGSGTAFSKRALASAKHLYLDDGLLCTSGKMSQLACVDEAGQPRRCDWDTNWGVLIRWYAREDRQAWGSGASSSIALEFRGSSGDYRLVAHRAGDPAQQAYCVPNYQSGRRVTPSEFKDCWGAGGSRLPDFSKIDYLALQLLSQETWLNFRFCLSAINLP
jgi:hypothetical protein